MPAQAGFIPIAGIFMNGAFFDSPVDNRERFTKQIFGSLFVIILNGVSQFFDLSPKDGFISSVDLVSAQTSPPLSNGGLMIGHE